jgi:hypothetical protein
MRINDKVKYNGKTGIIIAKMPDYWLYGKYKVQFEDGKTEFLNYEQLKIIE